MDRTLILLLVLLAATLAAYITGLVTYPLGWLIPVVLIFGRLGAPFECNQRRSGLQMPHGAVAGRYRR